MIERNFSARLAVVFVVVFFMYIHPFCFLLDGLPVGIYYNIWYYHKKQ
jgi:hypothetical protein